jgi:predicted HNH restriction endonuclease
VTRIDDLAIVCANCHRVIHLNNPPYTLDDVRKMLSPGERRARSAEASTPKPA